MKVQVIRFADNSDATLSLIYIDRAFACFGLEDEFRADKVMGETRIPAGLYNVGLRKYGRLHERYSIDTRFCYMHEGMLELRDVPGFTDILIHVGNTEDHTAGCLLLGEQADSAGFRLIRSAAGYMSFYKTVLPAAKQDALQIEFIDGDRHNAVFDHIASPVTSQRLRRPK